MSILATLLFLGPPAQGQKPKPNPKPAPKPAVERTYEVPFVATDQAIIVEAVINGHKVNCMFDTGFGGTVVLSDAVDLGKPTGKMYLRDFVGQFQVDTVRITSMKLGEKPIDPKGKEAVLQPGNRYTESYGTHCDGIMGFEVISDNITEINFEKSKFIFHPRSVDISKRIPDNKKTFLVPLLPTGKSSIELPVYTKDGKRMILALDTGNAFFGTTHKDVLQRVGLWGESKEPKFTTLAGVASGSVTSWYYKFKDVTIYGVKVPESYWSIIDAPSSSAEHDGTIGYQFLKNFNITIDYQRRYVWLERLRDNVGNDAPASVGISAFYDEDSKRVIIGRVSPETPAAKAGIRAGDFILTIDGNEIGQKSFEEIMRILEGPVGSKIVVTTSRQGVVKRNELTRQVLVNE